MQKVSYMGNGATTEFTFNFPYFENTDVVVTKNGAAATGYNIVGNSAGLDADIPYTGGTVVFETAPSAMDSITIARNLPMERQYDYQPLVKIDPTTLNQDFNYLLELFKDLADEFATLKTQYSEIADKESTTTLLSRIDTISQQITNLNRDTQDIGGIPGIAPKITTLDTRTTGVLDYVIESQNPTAENNYTWYRKYKSGWIEQGGYYTGNASVITLPVRMSNDNYEVLFSKNSAPSYWATTNLTLSYINTQEFCVVTYGDSANIRIGWQVSGIAA